jgi:hypothetical protein
MAEIILHHYPLSPYSEKIRLALGLKGATWKSVEIPVWTPRPKLTPMTGGYRRTPILQIGAEFYCDPEELRSKRTFNGSTRMLPGLPRFSPTAASSFLVRLLARLTCRPITRSGSPGKMAASRSTN